MTEPDTPYESPQEAVPQTSITPLHKPRRRAKRSFVFVLPVLGCLLLLSGGGILLWQAIHLSRPPLKSTAVQAGGPSNGQTPSNACASRLPWDWIAQQLPLQLHLTEAQVQAQLQAGKTVQAIAAMQGISAQQLYQIESQILHEGNVRWRQQGCLSQADYDDNEQRARAMTPAEMDQQFTSLYQG